jgi:uncharacterized membrane protein YeiH
VLASAGAVVVEQPLWAELSAVVAGALAGALFAARRRMDVIGVLGIAVVAGLGGGMIRDVLLNTVPLALRVPAYLWTVAAAAGVGTLFASAVQRFQWLLVGIDALALGMFTAIGVQRGVAMHLPLLSTAFLGAITGVGGSMLRDLFAGDLPPEAFRRGAPYASLAVFGAAAYAAALQQLGMDALAGEMVLITALAATRLVALWRGWMTPAPPDLTPRFLRPGGRARHLPPSGPSRTGPERRGRARSRADTRGERHGRLHGDR